MRRCGCQDDAKRTRSQPGTGAYKVEMQKILLVVEFMVLGGAVFSLFVKSQFRRKPHGPVETKRRYPKIFPDPAATNQARPGSEIRIKVDRPDPSEAMNALVDCLVREKNLAPRKPSDSRIHLILNAFLEQRKVPLEARVPLRPDSTI